MRKITYKHFLGFFIIAVILVSLFNVPINEYLIDFGTDTYDAKLIDKTVTNVFIIVLVFCLLKYLRIKYYFEFKNYKNYGYYLPLLFFVLVSSSNLLSIKNLDLSHTNWTTFLIFVFSILTSASLEEILFRGLFLGALLKLQPSSNKETTGFVVLSGLLFGIAHFMNVFYTTNGILGTVYQIYAAIGFGVLYGATYIKTRNLLVLILVHAITNFSSKIHELSPDLSTDVVELSENTNDTSLVVSSVLVFIIYGIPLAIGLLLLAKVDTSDIKKFE